MNETRLVQHGVTSGSINIVADNHYLPAFWAHPELGGTFPGLVLIHEWWGLTAQIRRQVRRLAELGFYVIAPDLFNHKTAHNADEGLALQQQLGEAGPASVAAALRALQTHHRCNGRIAVIGWQLGGELAYHAALHRTDLDAAIAFYGKPDDYLILMPATETPIMAFYGDKDPNIPSTMVERVKVALAKSSVKCEVVVYPGAMMGFFNDDLPTYDEQATADSWGRMLDFLCENLEVPRVTKRHDSPPQET